MNGPTIPAGAGDPLEVAAQWRLRLEEGDADDEGFERWLAEDPANVLAYERVFETQRFAEAAAGEGILRNLAPANDEAGPAGPSGNDSDGSSAPERSRWQYHRSIWAMAASLVVAIGLCGMLVLSQWQIRETDYQTAPGEETTIALADGSKMMLDGATRVRVRYSRSARSLVLESGQGRFIVAHDAERPFSVTSAGHEVVATGTDFIVEHLSGSTIVTLLRGHVLMTTPPPSTVAAIPMEPGDQVVVAEDRPPLLRHGVDLGAALAWQRGEIALDNERLADAVERFNRHNAIHIVADRETDEYRVSGIFHANDPAAFAAMIGEYYGLRLTRPAPNELRLARPRPPAG